MRLAQNSLLKIIRLGAGPSWMQASAEVRNGYTSPPRRTNWHRTKLLLIYPDRVAHRPSQSNILFPT